jgi:hypothetical protein
MQTPRTPPDTELRAGIALGIVVFFISLAAASMLFILMSEVIPPVLEQADPYTPGGGGPQAGDWIGLAKDYWPLYALVVAFFGLIARAVFQTRVA